MSEIEQYLPLARNIAKKLYKPNPAYGIEDLESVGYLSIVEKIQKYDPAKAKLITFLYTCIYRDMLKFVMKHKRKETVDSDLDLVETPEDPLVIDYLSFSPEDEITVLKSQGYNSKEIATKLGISIKKVRAHMRGVRDNNA